MLSQFLEIGIFASFIGVLYFLIRFFVRFFGFSATESTSRERWIRGLLIGLFSVGSYLYLMFGTDDRTLLQDGSCWIWDGFPNCQNQDEPPTVEPPTVEPPTVEPPTVEPPTVEPPTVEPPTVEPPEVDPIFAGASQSQTTDDFPDRNFVVANNAQIGRLVGNWCVRGNGKVAEYYRSSQGLAKRESYLDKDSLSVVYVSQGIQNTIVYLPGFREYITFRPSVEAATWNNEGLWLNGGGGYGIYKC